MIETGEGLTPGDLLPAIGRMWEASAPKIRAIDARCTHDIASPVFTVEGRYRAQGWTEWTRGFQHGAALLQYDATGDESFLTIGRDRTMSDMPGHLTHTGVHDHGFNNVSTYGNLLRLIREDRAEASDAGTCETALRASGAVQAARWTPIASLTGRSIGSGYIHSFNGAHSLFVDTIRSCRSLAVAHAMGQTLLGEQDERIDLLHRLVHHAEATARYSVYYGDGRDAYDEPGRAVHECLFNTKNGVFRAPSSQQGYSPFSTWTRGLAWAVAGFPELLEFLATREDDELKDVGGRAHVEGFMLKAAQATADHFIQHTPPDGVPYWDEGAPGLAHLGDWRKTPADPYNDHEPVDSSAAAIAAQGCIRLARVLDARGEDGDRYMTSGLRSLKTLLESPYLSTDDGHEGLLLHAVYHRPNGWDHIPDGRKVPCGESCMWGDYHLRELALYVQRLAEGRDYRFFDCVAAEGVGS
ncbi:MAG: glycosyl hydrolase [Phycisphaerae bacterium]|nr:glycosyl hydrolase [Phycisphaerae bacterium]